MISLKKCYFFTNATPNLERIDPGISHRSLRNGHHGEIVNFSHFGSKRSAGFSERYYSSVLHLVNVDPHGHGHGVTDYMHGDDKLLTTDHIHRRVVVERGL